MVSSTPRWWSRVLRKHLLVATAIGLIVLAACAPALADETASLAAVPADTMALARAAIVAGRLEDALRILNRIALSDRHEEERAVALEMRAIVGRWMAVGATIAARPAGEPAPLPEAGTEAPPPGAWESAFEIARARLVAGHFQEAGPDLVLLLDPAPSRQQWLRASALASLATDLVVQNRVLRVTVRSAPPDKAPIVRTHSVWYGWQIIVVDGMSLVVLPLAAARASSASAPLLSLAVGGYVLGGPIVHVAHGEIGRAAGSLGLRTGLPLAGAASGYLVGAATTGDCHGDLCGLTAVVFGAVGGVLGVVAATIIDPAALAYEKVPDAKVADVPARKPRALALAPLAGPRKDGGFDVGLGGTF